VLGMSSHWMACSAGYALGRSRVEVGMETAGVFKDEIIRCADCPAQFVWSADQQWWYLDHGLRHQPKRCKACRVTWERVRRERQRERRAAPPLLGMTSTTVAGRRP
jgi:hypothetical protein